MITKTKKRLHFKREISHGGSVNSLRKGSLNSLRKGSVNRLQKGSVNSLRNVFQSIKNNFNNC